MESRRRYTLRQFHPSPVNRNWRVKENYHLCANDLQKIDFCSQAAPGTKSKDEDHKTKITLGSDELDQIRSNFGRQPIKGDEILELMEHNKEALSQMDRKIKENIDQLKNDLKKTKENNSKSKESSLDDSSENKTPNELLNYLEVLRNYLPVKIMGMAELREITSREIEQFNMSDLKAIPNHVKLISIIGLAPFLLPFADVIFISGYTPGMEFLQTTYSSILLTTLGSVQLSSHFNDILHNKLNKEDIAPLAAPFSLAWLSLLAPGVGLVLNSSGLVLMLLGDIQTGRPRAPWYRSWRLATTSTAVVTMLFMVTAKVIS